MISRWLVQKDREIEALKKQVKSITEWKVRAETQAREIIKRLGRTIPSLDQIEVAVNKDEGIEFATKDGVKRYRMVKSDAKKFK